MKNLVRSIAILSLLCCLSGAYAQTELKPEWEVGAGFAAIDFPMYRGSNERRSFLLPIPYFVYRGETLQVNRERVRGLIFKRDTAEVLAGSMEVLGSRLRQMPTQGQPGEAAPASPALDAAGEERAG